MVLGTKKLQDVVIEGAVPPYSNPVADQFDEEEDDSDRQPLSPVNGRRENQGGKFMHTPQKIKDKGIMNDWSLVDARQAMTSSFEDLREPHLSTLLGQNALVIVRSRRSHDVLY